MKMGVENLSTKLSEQIVQTSMIELKELEQMPNRQSDTEAIISEVDNGSQRMVRHLYDRVVSGGKDDISNVVETSGKFIRTSRITVVSQSK